MTGSELVTFVKRRLGIEGVTDELLTTAVLEENITRARDDLVLGFALAAPIIVKEIVLLEQDVTNGQIWRLPAATKDPLRCLELRATGTQTPLEPSAKLNHDGGHYRWRTVREIELADGVTPPGGLEGDFILDRAAILTATTEAAIALPTPCHRAIGLLAAVYGLTVDEESDARSAMGLFQRELDRLERTYSEYDGMGGTALRQAILESLGTTMGDMIY